MKRLFIVIALWCVVTNLPAQIDSTIQLHNVTVTGNAAHDFQMKSSLSGIPISHSYLESHLAGSLMQTLKGIPGVQASSIGSGQSKPAIRGMGFNRMAVVENGIKHEGQQWGDDHGLEIDQFSIDRAEVIKGPGALLYGSDAIGGVLNLYSNHLPTKRFEGAAQLFGQTYNGQIGLSAKVGGRRNHFFYRAHATFADYADYHVPTDSIQYYSYYIKLKNRRLRNTAGMEGGGSLLLGYTCHHLLAYLRISDSYAKSGFFADAHGLEVRLSDIDYDRSRRDIDLPFQSVNHLKALGHITWQHGILTLEGDLGYQNNLREEHSEPVSHGYMPTPDNSLERRFNKSTATAMLNAKLALGEKHLLKTGISTEYQHNRRSGWGFIIPDFETFSIGIYAMERYKVNQNLILNAGLRYDFIHTHIHRYRDWYATPVEGDTLYKERSEEMKRPFHSFTWSAGLNYSIKHWVLKINIGKSFRVPIAKELGADGINYHIFRYEKGNAALKPEESYQMDAGISWGNRFLNIQADPFFNYFPNYIYLNPTAYYVEGLQLYQYTQAQVLRFGMDAQITVTIKKHWEMELKGEYLYARQLSGDKKGYGLPFSPPWSADAEVRYLYNWKGDGYVGISVHVAGAQKEIVPPEKPTDGYWTLNASAGKNFILGKSTLKLAINANNLLNKRYYDHTSYYRLIDVPEPGFNMTFMLGVDF